MQDIMISWCYFANKHNCNNNETNYLFTAERVPSNYYANVLVCVDIWTAHLLVHYYYRMYTFLLQFYPVSTLKLYTFFFLWQRMINNWLVENSDESIQLSPKWFWNIVVTVTKRSMFNVIICSTRISLAAYNECLVGF